MHHKSNINQNGCICSKVTELSGSGTTSKGQKGKGKESSQSAEVCVACKPYIDHGEELPLPLLAQLIKFRLLTAKNADQQRRQLEMKVGLMIFKTV